MTTDCINLILGIAVLIVSCYGSIYAYRSYMLQKKNNKPVLDFYWQSDKPRWNYYTIKNSGGTAIIQQIKFDTQDFKIVDYNESIKGKAIAFQEKISFKVLQSNGNEPKEILDGIIITYLDSQQFTHKLSYSIRTRETSKRLNDARID